MRNILTISLIFLALTACATNPQRFAGQLDSADKKFTSKECSDVRLKSLDFDEKIGSRMAIGFFSGLLLGPFGIPIGIAADASHNEDKKNWNRELHLRCSSQPLPDELRSYDAL